MERSATAQTEIACWPMGSLVCSAKQWSVMKGSGPKSPSTGKPLRMKNRFMEFLSFFQRLENKFSFLGQLFPFCRTEALCST